jgi:hypothetical protein
MENLNQDQFAHLNPDTECAAFEQVCDITRCPTPKYYLSSMSERRRNHLVRERTLTVISPQHVQFSCSYGEVYKARCTRSGIICAMKRMKYVPLDLLLIQPAPLD